MTYQDWGAVGELIGGFAVVITLVYLALQIRQNTETVRATTELETGRLWSELHARVAHSADMADIWDKGHTRPSELTDTEKRRFIWFIAEYFFLVENLYRQREIEFLSLESWKQHERAVAGLLLNPTLAAWWESGVSPFSEEFVAQVNRAREELGDAVWSYTPMTEFFDSARIDRVR